MTRPKVVVRNVYCADPEDRVVEYACPCCVKCWLFVASKNNRKNGSCPFDGPFTGFDRISNRDRQ